MWKTFPSLYFQDRNLQSSFCSLVDFGLPFLPCASQSCHFCTQCCYSYILLKETKIIVHKNSFMENLPVQSCPIFLPHNPYIDKPIKQQSLQKHNRVAFLCICRFGDWNFSYTATLATKTFRLLPPWRVLLKRFFEPWVLHMKVQFHPRANFLWKVGAATDCVILCKTI